MSDTYVRVDDRLIHGQTIVAWCPTLSIEEIIAVDDASAKNPMLKSIMTMGVPSAYKTHIVTAQEAVELLAKESKVNRLVIVKSPQKLLNIKEGIANAKSIVLGNIAKRDDTIYNMKGATGIFYLSKDDVEVIDQFSEKGIPVYFRQLPTTSKKDWAAFKKTI